MTAHPDVESQLMHAGFERFPECPRCASTAGYLTTWDDGGIAWDDGGILEVLFGFLRLVPGRCVRRGGHFDLWCRTCYIVVATRAPRAK